MKKLLSTLVAGGVVSLAIAGIAFATVHGTYKISATLGPKAEVPAPKATAGAKGTFSGTYKENAKGAVLTFTLTFSGLSGAATAAHIHMAKPGVAGNVIVPLCAPCKSPMTGKTTISKSTITALEAGTTYVNVHTVKNAAGEIRGQVKVTG